MRQAVAHLRDEPLVRGSVKNGVLSAREMYRKALELDPTSARAHAGLALSFVEELWSDWTIAPRAAAGQSVAFARKAETVVPIIILKMGPFPMLLSPPFE